MNLPFFQKKKPEASNGYYLTLLLTDEKVSALILHEHLDKVAVIGHHEEYSPEHIESLDEESLINLIDKTVSRAEEVLPPQIETHKTVFGVKPEWIDQATQKIKKEYLSKLKKVCDALDLTPIGFMVTTEAISHLLQEEEGAPLSAVLAEIGHQKVTVTLFRGGKAIESIEGERGEHAPATVDKLLHHFTIPALPARIILFDSHEIAKLSQSFISHQWSKSLPFIHVPQITVLKPGFDVRAVATGAMSQMGLVVIKPNEEATSHESHEKLAEAIEPEEKMVEEESEPKQAEEDFITADNFGFVANQDIATAKPETSHKQEREEPKHSLAHAPVIHEHASAVSAHAHHNRIHRELPEDDDQENTQVSIVDRLRGITLPKVQLPAFPTRFKKGFIMPIVLLLGMAALIGGIIYYYLYQMQAHVIISVKPKMVEETGDVFFSATEPSEFSTNTIAAKTITQSLSGEVTTDTTGKKEVGEKAKGTVTIYNNDDSKVEVASGTTLKASTGVTFLVDKDIIIASASGDIFSGTKPGTGQVAVTAKDIGTDGNLPSGTKFTVNSNNSLAAKNDSAFSGGSKKQITVVSKDDLAKLRTDLPKSLEAKAREQLQQEAGGSETLLPSLITVGLEKPTFDADVDDEAKKLKLKATVVFQGLVYTNAEVTEYAKALLKDKYSDESVFAEDTIKAEVNNLKTKGKDGVSGTILIQGGMLPKIKTEDVVERLEGRSLGDAQTVLSNLPQIAKQEITFSPPIPFLPHLFPTLPKHITVEIRSE